MQKDGILILSHSVLPETQEEPNHTLPYGGESAFLALLLSRLASNVQLMINDAGELTDSLERTFKENSIRCSYYPSQKPVDVSMSFSVASGALGGSPLATDTTLPLQGSLFMCESFQEQFKDLNYIVIPSYLLGSEKGRELSMAALQLSQRYGTNLAFFGGMRQLILSQEAQSVLEEILPHLSFLAITAHDCQALFGHKVAIAGDCDFLSQLSFPLLWVDLGEAGNLIMDKGRSYRTPLASSKHRQQIPVALIREVFFISLLWRLNEHVGKNQIPRAQITSYIQFARNMVSYLPSNFSTPFDLPSHDDALRAMTRSWWKIW